MADLNEYTNPDTNVERQIVKLFGGYTWTVDYRINTLKEKLPDDLNIERENIPKRYTGLMSMNCPRE